MSAAYVEGNVHYEDIESIAPERDEANAARARKAIVELDGLAALVRLLDMPDVEVVVAATGALFNAALGASGADALRALDGVVGKLIDGCLAHADARVRGNGAGVLMNLAAHSESARAQLFAAGALPALLALGTAEVGGVAAADGDVVVVARAVGALNNLALHDEAARALCAPGASAEADAAAARARVPGAPAPARAGLSGLLELVHACAREDVLEDAAMAVRRILEVEPAARAELVALNGLPAVARLVGMADEELQLRGCELLRLCALTEPRAHSAALELRLEVALVARLSSASEEVQEAAVRAATVLFVSPAFGRAFRKADGIAPLVELLRARDGSLLSASLFCLGQLARADPPSRARIRDEEGLEPTVRLLTHGALEIATAAAHVLRFASTNEEVKRVVRELGALPTLCALLAAGEAQPALTTACVGALANLVWHEPDGATAVRLAGGFEAALPLLASADPELALLSASLCERALYGSADTRTHFRAVGALRPLVAQLGHASVPVRLAIVGALAHAAHLDAPNQVRLRELGAAVGLVSILLLPREHAPQTPRAGGRPASGGAAELAAHHELQRRACWALSHLACEPLGAVAARSAGALAAVLELVSEPAAPPSLLAAGTSLLFNCAMNDGAASCAHLYRAGAIAFALGQMAGARGAGQPESAAHAAGILSSLAFATADAAREIGEQGGLALLLEAARPSEPALLSANASSALCNVAAKAPALADAIFELGAVGAMVALVDPSASEQPAIVVNQACALLVNLMNSPAGRDAGRDAGAPRALVELMDDPSAQVKAVAARVLCNLACAHADNCQAVADAGGLQPLLAMLLGGPPDRVLDVTTHSDVQLACSLALRNLTVGTSCAEAVVEATVEVEGSAPRSGLAALVQALLLGQPHESIKAKTHVAAALANVAQLVEARAVLEREGLLPAAVAVLGEALRPITRAKALAQAGGEQPAVADGAEMDALLAELCTHLCMLLRNAALSPACKGAICEGTPALQLLVGLVRTADSPALLAQAAGALQNLQDRSEVRPGMPTNPIGDGERSMLKVHQLKQRLHASGEGADAPLPPALAHVDDDMEDEGPGARTKDDYRLLHAAKLGATHDVKELKGPFTSLPITVSLARQTPGCSRRQPPEYYELVPTPFPSPVSSPRLE